MAARFASYPLEKGAVAGLLTGTMRLHLDTERELAEYLGVAAPSVVVPHR